MCHGIFSPAVAKAMSDPPAQKMRNVVKRSQSKGEEHGAEDDEHRDQVMGNEPAELK